MCSLLGRPLLQTNKVYKIIQFSLSLLLCAFFSWHVCSHEWEALKTLSQQGSCSYIRYYQCNIKEARFFQDYVPLHWTEVGFIHQLCLWRLCVTTWSQTVKWHKCAENICHQTTCVGLCLTVDACSLDLRSLLCLLWCGRLRLLLPHLP